MPSTGAPSTSAGPVQPFGVRSTIMGHAGRARRSSARDSRRMRAMSSRASSIAAAIRRCMSLGLGALHEDRPVAVALDERAELRLGMRASTVGLAIFQPLRCRIGSTAPSPAGSRNLFECQLVASGPVSASPSPTTQQTTRSGLSKRGAVGVRERVAELAALVNGARCLRGDVARDPAGEGELAKEAPHPLLVERDLGIDLGVGALQPRVGHDRRAPVARARSRTSPRGRALGSPGSCARRRS